MFKVSGKYLNMVKKQLNVLKVVVPKSKCGSREFVNHNHNHNHNHNQTCVLKELRLGYKNLNIYSVIGLCQKDI